MDLGGSEYEQGALKAKRYSFAMTNNITCGEKSEISTNNNCKAARLWRGRPDNLKVGEKSLKGNTESTLHLVFGLKMEYTIASERRNPLREKKAPTRSKKPSRAAAPPSASAASSRGR